MHWLDFNARLAFYCKISFTSAYINPSWFITPDTGTTETESTCSALQQLSQKGQDTVKEIKHLCLSFTEGWPWTFLYVLQADDLNDDFYIASQKISKFKQLWENYS